MTSDSQWRSIALTHGQVSGPEFNAANLDHLGSRTASAIGSVDTAVAAIKASSGVVWVSETGDEFRARVDDMLVRLSALRGDVKVILDKSQALAQRTWASGVRMPRVAGNWPQAARQPRFVVGPAGGGVAMRLVDGGYTSVDPDTLAKAALLLDDAATALDDAQRELGAYRYSYSSHFGRVDEVQVLCDRVGAISASIQSPAHRAQDVRELGSTTRAAAQEYSGSETRVHGWMRSACSLAGWLIAENPVVSLALFRGTAPVAGGIGLGLWVSSLIDPDGTADSLGRIGGAAIANGAVDGVIAGVTGWLAASPPGMQPPTLRPVQEAAEQFAWALAALSGPVVVVPVVDPPDVPVAVGFAGAMSLVALSDTQRGVDGSEPARPGTMTIQRIDQPDGSRSWLVAVPGTEAILGGQIPLDGVSDVEFAAGVAEAVTPGVLEAMDEAGIPSDESIVFAGHSLGGMIAMSAAGAAVASGRFRIGGLITAGSPNIPRGLPQGVPTIRLEHDEDAVPHADDEPTQVTADANLVQRSLGDVRPAHFITEYQVTAALEDAALADEPLPGSDFAKVTSLLGRDGATATTTQYQLIRQDGGDSEAAPGGGGW